MTQLETAQKGKVTEEMRKVAIDESIDIDELRILIATGKVVSLKERIQSPFKFLQFFISGGGLLNWLKLPVRESSVNAVRLPISSGSLLKSK